MILLVLACADGQPADSGGVVPVDAGLIEEGVVTCADPSAREELGPMYVPDLGEPWTSQLTSEMDPEDRNDAIGLVVADLTGDGRYEILLTNKGPSWVFRLERDGTLSHLSDDILPDRRSHQYLGGVGLDHDADGDVDVLMYGVEYDTLYRNVGGHLVDISEAATDFADVVYPTKAGSCGDLDGDGDLDCILGTETSTRQAEHSPPDLGWPTIVAEYDDGVFKQLPGVLSEEANYSYAFMETLLDLDGDGDLDLYNVNAFGGVMWGNRVLMNVTEPGGPIAFDDVSDGHPLSQSMDGMGLGVGDVNGDELPDLVVTDWGRLFMYESVGGGDYIDTTAARGLTLDYEDDREIAWGAELQDMDNDGDLDLVVLFGRSLRGETKDKPQIEEQPDGLWLQEADGQFVQRADEWQIADDLGPMRGFALVDLNDDGHLDMVKRGISEPARLYLSRCSANHWLKVRLADAAPNTHGIGARVRVTTASGTQIRWVMAGGTSMAYGGPNEVHFGLGSDQVVERLEVLWPDGGVSRHEDITPDQKVWVARERTVVGMPD
ncbi:MAG: CRTAC1 family protein [Proteobacteria bacterium]|nr:CRTAC1 family protein [Pseudomonadota bacterium]MCP4921693.1 CRTAC1 family protein [Pseudomonadota bacterium]